MDERNRPRYRSRRIQESRAGSRALGEEYGKGFQEEQDRISREEHSRTSKKEYGRGSRQERNRVSRGGQAPRRRNRRKRRRRKTQRMLAFALLTVLCILIAVLLFSLFRFLKQEIGEDGFGGFSLPWSKEEGVIMLDAGHGGKDQGASSFDALEKELNLEITQRVEKLLKDAGYRVLMTRSEDDTMDIYERVRYANRKKPDLYVSIHCNFLEKGQADGIETYYAESKEQGSQELAEKIQTKLIEKTDATDRGVRTEDFLVIKDTEMPAVLVETGFLSDDRERELLQDERYQQWLAEGIAEGILQYCEEQKEEKGETKE